MASIKDRVGRLEERLNVVVDRSAIERDAKLVTDNIERLAAAFRTSGRPMPSEAERVTIRATLDAFTQTLRHPREEHA
jgi:hypothetical protein